MGMEREKEKARRVRGGCRKRERTALKLNALLRIINLKKV